MKQNFELFFVRNHFSYQSLHGRSECLSQKSWMMKQTMMSCAWVETCWSHIVKDNTRNYMKKQGSLLMETRCFQLHSKECACDYLLVLLSGILLLFSSLLLENVSWLIGKVFSGKKSTGTNIFVSAQCWICKGQRSSNNKESRIWAACGEFSCLKLCMHFIIVANTGKCLGCENHWNW